MSYGITHGVCLPTVTQKSLVLWSPGGLRAGHPSHTQCDPSRVAVQPGAVPATGLLRAAEFHRLW